MKTLPALTRRHFLAAASAAAQTPQPRRPTNVVFILSDDHGEWAVNLPGQPSACGEMRTPHLAQLAAGGMRFSNAFAATPVCSPSRMTYMTGKLPSQHGVQDFLLEPDTRPGRRFLTGQKTIAEVFQAHGYATGVCGKWHMGDDANPHAGFDYWRITPNGGGGPYKNPSFSENGELVQREGYKTALTAGYALDFLERNRRNPFFLYVPFHAPHTPFDYQDPEDRTPYLDSQFSCFPEGPRHPQRRANQERMLSHRESKLSYSALVTGLDTAVGRIVGQLDRLGLRENTLIVFSADQGWNAGHHGFWGKGNGTIPFNMYEQSIRVPLVWNHPGKIQAGAVHTSLVSSYDAFPSLCDYLGFQVASDAARPGRSYAPAALGRPYEARDALFFEICHARAIRTAEWKFVQRADGWPNELFHLPSDPGEEVNRAGDVSARPQAQKLLARLEAFFGGLGSPPIGDWRSTTKQRIPLDSGYYAEWWKRNGSR